MQSFTQTKHTGLKIHQDGIKFKFDFRLNGIRFRHIFKANTVHSKADRLKSAYDALEKFKDDTRRTKALDDDININATINNYWNQLLKIKKNVWSDPHSYKMDNFYKRYIKDNIGKKKVIDIKSSNITQFNVTISHLSTRSQKVAYECLTPIFNLAIEDEIIIRSPIKKNHRPIRKAIEEKKIIVNAIETSKAVNKAIHKVFKDRPDLRGIFLFCYHGRRWGETTSLQWEDIDFDNDSYIVRAENSKVNVDMSFTLPGEVKEALSHFRNVTGDVFPVKRIEKHFEDIRDEKGVPKEFTCHWLRNLYVSTLSELGVEAIHLSSALGHTDTNTVKQYLSLQRKSSTKKTTDAMEKLLNQ